MASVITDDDQNGDAHAAKFDDGSPSADRSKNFESQSNKDGSSVAGLSSRDVIHGNAQQLIEGLNNKRKQDTEVIGHFKKALDMHVEKATTAMEQNLFQIYHHQSEHIQTVLHELFATLDRVAAIETELSQFKQVMSTLYEKLNGPT